MGGGDNSNTRARTCLHALFSFSPFFLACRVTAHVGKQKREGKHSAVAASVSSFRREMVLTLFCMLVDLFIHSSRSQKKARLKPPRFPSCATGLHFVPKK